MFEFPDLLITIAPIQPGVLSHKHLSHLQQPPQILSNSSSHAWQIRPTSKIPRSAPGIISLALKAAHTSSPSTTDQFLQTPWQPHTELRKYLCQDPTSKQRHDDENEDLQWVPAHVIIQVADETAETAHKPVGVVASWLSARRGVISFG